jgi:GH18 family chitinase
MGLIGLRRLRSGVVLTVLVIVAAVLVATAGDDRATAAPPNGFKSVGYLPSYAGDINTIPYGKLTHINYAFVMPDANGTLPDAPNPARLRDLVRLGHAKGVKILISVGGWNNGDDSAFEALAADPTARTAFVTNAMAMVATYGLDGVDIDWEYPDSGTSADNFSSLMAALGAALHAKGKLLTAAVISNGNTQGIKPAVFGSVDFLNIMLYDGGTPHANFDWTIAYLNAWKAKGLPAAKTVVGIPFYARPAYASYAQLVARDPLNADRDCTMIAGRPACANGRATVARKTQWAVANGGGVMYWELSNDTVDARSLVTVIEENSRGMTSAPISGEAGRCVDVRRSGRANGTPVQLYGCNATGAQWWTIDGTGAIRALGKCLDVPGSSTANGAQLQLWDCNGTGAQKWQARPDGTLLNPNSNKCLDAAAFGTTDGTRLQIWDCSGAPNQAWALP